MIRSIANEPYHSEVGTSLVVIAIAGTEAVYGVSSSAKISQMALQCKNRRRIHLFPLLSSLAVRSLSGGLAKIEIQSGGGCWH